MRVPKHCETLLTATTNVAPFRDSGTVSGRKARFGIITESTSRKAQQKLSSVWLRTVESSRPNCARAVRMHCVPLTSTMHISKPNRPHGTDFTREVVPSLPCFRISSEKVWHTGHGRGRFGGGVREWGACFCVHGPRICLATHTPCGSCLRFMVCTTGSLE